MPLEYGVPVLCAHYHRLAQMQPELKFERYRASLQRQSLVVHGTALRIVC